MSDPVKIRNETLIRFPEGEGEPPVPPDRIESVLRDDADWRRLIPHLTKCGTKIQHGLHLCIKALPRHDLRVFLTGDLLGPLKAEVRELNPSRSEGELEEISTSIRMPDDSWSYSAMETFEELIRRIRAKIDASGFQARKQAGMQAMLEEIRYEILCGEMPSTHELARRMNRPVQTAHEYRKELESLARDVLTGMDER